MKGSSPLMVVSLFVKAVSIKQPVECRLLGEFVRTVLLESRSAIQILMEEIFPWHFMHPVLPVLRTCKNWQSLAAWF